MEALPQSSRHHLVSQDLVSTKSRPLHSKILSLPIIKDTNSKIEALVISHKRRNLHSTTRLWMQRQREVRSDHFPEVSRKLSEPRITSHVFKTSTRRIFRCMIKRWQTWVATMVVAQLPIRMYRRRNLISNRTQNSSTQASLRTISPNHQVSSTVAPVGKV